MKQGYTHIVMVLDRSGSMGSVIDDTIGGFNQFLSEQKSGPGMATLTLVQFDNVYEFVHKNRRIADVPPLDRSTFVPRGGTALLDAVGRAVNETGAFLRELPQSERPSQVIFVIITDGGENSSREFTRDKVFDMISHQRSNYSWQFVFLGANQDAIQAGSSLGISKGSSLTYASNAMGSAAAYAAISRRTTECRLTGEQLTSGFFNQSDRDAQVAAGAPA